MKKIQRQNSRVIRTLPITRNPSSMSFLGLPPIRIQTFSLLELVKKNDNGIWQTTTEKCPEDSLQLTDSSGQQHGIIDIDEYDNYQNLQQLIQYDDQSNKSLDLKCITRKNQWMVY
ncbi:hypothetical protein SS50377_26240 [Spironucleus salmonicida]|uniref:Uncharacterized protein n=1 Tax=Spironucleus salmonicida TaxID=348837 RepID=A0A9P8LPZ2_9EUKA|nr:hypothetical protein SS50377_26240 [Spironucleus salmonicida]